jgi:hypothetical protein
MNRELAAKFLNKLNRDELLELNKMLIAQVREVDRQIGRREALRYYPGQKVLFTRRRGTVIPAVVERINPKTVTVTVQNGRGWRVPYSMVSPA